MDFEDKEISRFILYWSKAFGEKLSPEEARANASSLLELYIRLAAPRAPRKPRDQNEET